MKQWGAFFLVLVLWVVALVLFFNGRFIWLLPGLLLLHLFELLVIGWRTGKQYGLTAGRTILMCMLYGFIWWLPLRRRMKLDDLTDEDFVEDGLEPWREVQLS